MLPNYKGKKLELSNPTHDKAEGGSGRFITNWGTMGTIQLPSSKRLSSSCVRAKYKLPTRRSL